MKAISRHNCTLYDNTITHPYSDSVTSYVVDYSATNCILLDGTAESDSNNSHSHIGIITGGVLGGVITILIIVILILLARRKKGNKEQNAVVPVENNPVYNDAITSTVDHSYSTIGPHVTTNSPVYYMNRATVTNSPITEQHGYVNVHNDHHLYDTVPSNTISGNNDGNTQYGTVDSHSLHNERSHDESLRRYGVVNQPKS